RRCPVSAARSASSWAPSTCTGTRVPAVTVAIRAPSSRATVAARPGGTRGGPSGLPVSATIPLAAQSATGDALVETGDLGTSPRYGDREMTSRPPSSSEPGTGLPLVAPSALAAQATAPLLAEDGRIEQPLLLVDLDGGPEDVGAAAAAATVSD